MQPIQYMIRFRKFLPVYVLLVWGFFSCEKEIAFNGEITEPRLVVNSILTPDTIIMAHLSQSRFLLGEQNEMPAVENGEVNLWVNGESEGTLRHIAAGFYVSTFRPSPDDFIHIEAGAQDFHPVSAETFIPATPDFAVSDTTVIFAEEEIPIWYESRPDAINIVRFRETAIRLRLTDTEPTVDNYYFIKGTKTVYGTDGVIFTQPLEVELSDILRNDLKENDLLSELIDGEESKQTYNLFNDLLMGGKNIYLDYATSDIVDSRIFINGEEQDTDLQDIVIEYRFEVGKLSKDLYLYLVSGDKAQKTKDNFLAEPVQVHNNILNGIGILGAYATKKVSIHVPAKYDGNYY